MTANEKYENLVKLYRYQEKLFQSGSDDKNSLAYKENEHHKKIILNYHKQQANDEIQANSLKLQEQVVREIAAKTINEISDNFGKLLR